MTQYNTEDNIGRGQWETDYDERTDWCIECGDLFNRDWLKDGLCQRCRT